MADERVGISIRLSPEEHQALQVEAREQDRSMNWIIREAIRDYINGHRPGQPRIRP